jgi:hypothetical protein
VGDGEATAGVSDAERLGVDEHGRAGGGITHVSNTEMALQASKDIFVENFAHQPHALVMAHQSTIADADAGTLLAPVLKGIETEIGKTGGVFVPINGEDATLFLWSTVRDNYGVRVVAQSKFLKCLNRKCLKYTKI